MKQLEKLDFQTDNSNQIISQINEDLVTIMDIYRDIPKDLNLILENDLKWLKGFIDEFSLFDRVVDIGEVYIADREPINLTGSSGLIGYWRFEEGTGAVASDSSGKGNTGTLVNSPAWTTDTP